MNQSEPSQDTPEISTDIDKEITNTNEFNPEDQSAPSSNESEDTPATNDRPPSKKITWNMILREILFILALVLTTYDALQNSPPKISKVPSASPLFGKGSLVNDWYKGQLSSALARISSSEISFVMYYAPWDAETLHVSKEFEKAAILMFKQVHFAAVNCWQPGGECRQQHYKISVWPIIMVYTVHLKSVVYTGPKDTMSMVKFLRKVMNPLHRITDHSDFLKLVSECDIVAVGFDMLSNQKKFPKYGKIYNVALKSLEYDPFGDVCFGVVTSPALANQLGVELFPTFKLVMWNETLEYPADLEFTDDNLMTWMWENVHKKSSWHTPQWQKSFAMQKIFAAGPVMILFTPRNLYYDRNPNHDLLREVALEYNNCFNPETHNVIKYIALQRRRLIEDENILHQKCIEFKQSEDAKEKLRGDIFSESDLKVERVSKSKCLNKTTQKSKSNEQTFHSFWSMDSSQLYSDANGESLSIMGISKCSMESVEDSCPSVYNCLDNTRIVSESPVVVLETKETFDYKTSMLTQDDTRSSINLTKRKIKEMCILMELAEKYHTQVYPVIDEGQMYKIEGLACKSNKSLAFLALDSLTNHHFAESLGIDILNIKNHTAVVILDNERESQYILKEPYGERSLRDFVYNFTTDRLTRNLRTVTLKSKYTHYYGSDKIRDITDKDIINGVQMPSCENGDSLEDKVFIYDLNTNNFQNFIMQKNKAVLVAMCSGGVGACGGLLSLTLLAVNRIFGASGILSIGRIDSTKHDLPWQHTVPKYPSLIFFPMTRKSDYFSYPENQPINIEGVLGFILSGMEAPVRLYAQVQLCNQTKTKDAMSKCLGDVRVDTVSLISTTLKQFRRFNKTSVKNLLLKHLEYLRAVYISLGALNTTKLPFDHPVVVSFREAIRSLINIWNVKAIATNVRVYGPLNKSHSKFL